MAHINVPPTRSNLMRMKQDLQFAREGYEILDRKREVLTTELIRVAHDAGELQQEVWELVAAAYRALGQAKLTMGQEHLEWAAMATTKTVDVHLKFRGVMGVPIPVVEAHGAAPEMTYGMGDTNATLDEAGTAFRSVLKRIPELSERVTSVWRLAGELRKTQRRVNALQHIFIPEYEETVLFIKSALEEREREETFRLKWLKTKMTRADVEAPERDYAQTQPFA
ncbi:MAG TPA: V-type ATP synthase subunit D [Anaerolineales bacterium]|nr:V-type ATP synthase subunit D [Anaerolineales bacterium]